MKKLGLVGGIGPESTIDYYRGIIAGYRQRLAQDTYPQMVIDSLNLKEMYIPYHQPSSGISLLIV